MVSTARRTRHNYASHDYRPEDVTPLYDNLLVRRIYDAPISPIIDPGVHQTLDGRWLKNSDEGPRKGVVVAIGPGDRKKTRCEQCQSVFYEEQADPHKHAADGWACPKCSYGWAPYLDSPNHSLAVQIGDTIIYPRFESSHVKIGEEMLTFVHEADVMAVIEP